MGYLLRMSDELHDWLADLRDSDPPAAALVGQALIALMEEGPSLGPPLVISLPGSVRPSYPPEALDHSYRDRLVRLQVARRSVADAATLAEDIRLEIAELTSLHASLSDQHEHALDAGDECAAAEAEAELGATRRQLAELRRLLPGVIEAEKELNRKLQHLQEQVDTFRARKEVLTATFRAAQAEQEVRASLPALGVDAVERAGAAAPAGGGADRLREVTGEIEAELARDRVPAHGLMELRPGSPGDSDTRVIYAVEPHGTALLIAVLEGREAVEDQRAEAVQASSDLLRGVREGGAPEASARGFDDVQAFLDEFFPGSAAEVEAGAAALVARNRARTLAEQRNQLGLTQAQVAERMGVRQERVSAIERAAPGATEVRTLAGYVAALGGRLDIIADFGDERVVLR